MARIAGRNTPVAIIMTLLCVAVVVALLVLARPILPAVWDWIDAAGASLVDLIRQALGG